MSVTIGKPAPNFKLFNTEKKEISLVDYRGKNLVILFFPLAFTGTCTAELCTIRDSYDDYSSLDAEVIGVSIDESGQLPGCLGADVNAAGVCPGPMPHRLRP